MCRPGPPPSSLLGGRALLAASLACWALVVVCRWPVRSEAVFNWDSVNHALAVDEYDLRKHQPHPPGYPVWIAAVRGVVALGLDPNDAQIALAQLFTGVAVAVVALLAAAAAGTGGALLAGALLLFCPLVALYSSVAGTYASELMTSALAGWFGARLWRRERRLAPLAGCVVALSAGLRPSAAVFVAPLLAVCTARAAGASLRTWLATLGAGALGIAAWLAPLLVHTGGWGRYRHAARTLFTEPVARSSWFYGAPLADHLVMALRVTLWIAMACAAGGLVVAALALSARLARRRAARMTASTPAAPTTPEAAASATLTTFAAPAPPAAPATPRSTSSLLPSGRAGAALLALWILPAPAFSYLVFGPYPGYLVAALPGATLLLGVLGGRSIDAIAAARGGRRRGAVTALAVTAVALLSTALSLAPFEPSPAVPPSVRREILDTLHVASLRQVRDSDELLAHVAAAVRGAPVGPEHSALVALDVKFNSANYRKLSWVLPELPVLWMSRGRTALEQSLGRRSEPVDALEVGARRRLWWVVQGAELPAEIAAAFPGTRRVLLEHDVSLWASELPAGPFERTIEHGRGTHRVRRS